MQCQGCGAENIDGGIKYCERCQSVQQRQAYDKFKASCARHDEIMRLRKEKEPQDVASVGMLKQELRRMEFQQMSSVLSPESERELIDAQSRLRARIKVVEDYRQQVTERDQKADEQHAVKMKLYEQSVEMRNQREPIPNQLKHQVWRRDKFTCCYCGKSINDVDLEVDHILPVSKGGTIALSNLQTLCFECNRKKSDL